MATSARCADSLMRLQPAERMARGYIPMREDGFTTVRLEMIGGRVESGWLQSLSDLARRFGRGYVHVTTRQGIELPYVPNERLDEFAAALAESGLQTGGCGPRLRTIVACPGLSCRWGIIDAQGLARRLGRAVRDRTLPHKFKVAVSGCPNGCAKPIENDFGVLGARPKTYHADNCNLCGNCVNACPVPGVLSADGGELAFSAGHCIDCGKCVDSCPSAAWQEHGTAYAILVGGKMGRVPRLARRLPFLAAGQDEVLGLLDAILTWYCSNGHNKERFADTIERVGFDSLLDAFGEERSLQRA